MDKFLRLYKVFFTSKEYRNQYHLTPLELKVYIYIELQKSFLTDVSTIHIDSLLFFLDKSLSVKNRNQMKDVFLELSDKCVIQIIEAHDNIFMIENRFSDSREYQFKKISIEELQYILKEVNTESLLYLYLALKTWETQEDQTSFSNEALASICHSSKRSIQRQTKQLEEMNLISVSTGKYQKNIICTLGFMFLEQEEESDTLSLKPTDKKKMSIEEILHTFRA